MQAVRPLTFAIDHDCPAFLVLDAFFSIAGVFRLAQSVASIALCDVKSFK